MSINRRNFNKLLSALPFSAAFAAISGKSCLGKNESVEIKQPKYIPNIDLINKEVFDNGEIFKLFQAIDCTKETGPLEFPLSFYTSPQSSIIAYTKNKNLYKRNINCDYVEVFTFNINYNYENKSDSELIKLINEDLSKQCWGLMKAAAEDRNIAIYDGDADLNKFSKRLVSLMKVVMRRNGYNNSLSLDRGKLTDLYLSPEYIKQIKNWGLGISDEVLIEDAAITVFGVNLNSCNYLSEKEVIGVDLRNRDNFVLPIKSFFKVNKEKSEISAEIGIAILNNLSVLDGRIN